MVLGIYFFHNFFWHQCTPVSLAVVDPLGGAKALVSRAPVEQAGIAVQGVQQVCGGADDSANIHTHSLIRSP